MTILQILEDIGSDTKRSHKLALVEQNKINELFMRVVKLALDPYVNYFIRKIPGYKTNGNNKPLDWALNELNVLINREATGHAGIAHLKNLLENVSKDDAIVIERIIGRDLRCGMSDGTINAVVEKFIPSYPCLLARAADPKNLKNIQFPALSQKKADGLRVNFIVEKNKITICGRSGREIDLLGEMEEEIRELGNQYSEPVVFDGELVVADSNGKLQSRKIGNGILNQAIKGTIDLKQATLVRAQLWDVIPLKEFQEGISKLNCRERFQSLHEAILKTKNQSKFWIIPYKTVNNFEEAIVHFQEMLKDGEEGTILKDYRGFWEDSRSKYLVKMKSEKTCDLEIIGWKPGQGQFEGLVGSLECASNDRKVQVNISGFPVDLRKEITETINQRIGKIVQIKYNERITSQGKDREEIDSLFLPRYDMFRTDKLVADSSDEII